MQTGKGYKRREFCLMGAWQPSRHTNSVNMKSIVFRGFREPLQTFVTDIQNTRYMGHGILKFSFR